MINIDLPLISSNLSHTSREHLEEEDNRKIKSLYGAVLASQQAEKKRKEKEEDNKSGHEGSPEDTADAGSDDVDGETSKHDDGGEITVTPAAEDERSCEDEAENETGGEKPVARSGGAASLKNRLSEFLHFTLILQNPTVF